MARAQLRRLPVALILVVIAAAAVAAPALLARAPQAGAAPDFGFARVVTHGGLASVSGIMAGAPGDITAQTTAVLDEMQARLAGVGSGLARVTAATVYLADAADFAAVNAVWAKRFPVDPPTRTTVVVPLPREGARIQVSAVATTGTTERAIVLPTGWLKSPSPYSYGIRSGDTLFLAGLVSRNGKDNTAVPGDITAQTHTVFANAKAILAEAGFALTDIVSARVFITDVANFEAMNATYRTYFPEAPPARATVKTALTSPDYLVEITFLAVKGAGRKAVLTPNADGTPGRANPNLSSAIALGPRLFLSGMLGVVPNQPPDVTAQTGETLARLGRTLEAAGFRWADAFDSTVYVTDVKTAGDVAALLRAKAARPGGLAGTVVGSGLVSADGRVEIMLTAGK